MIVDSIVDEHKGWFSIAKELFSSWKGNSATVTFLTDLVYVPLTFSFFTLAFAGLLWGNRLSTSHIRIQ